MSYCPEGSSYQIHYGGLIWCVVLDGFLLLLYALYALHRRKITRIGLEKNDEEMKLVGDHNTGGEPVNGRDIVGDENRQNLLKGYLKAFQISEGENLRNVLGMCIDFKNLEVSLKGGKTILNGVSGQISTGKLTAVMGPSGAGKTTFMNALMGKISRSNGEMLINGKPLELSSFKKITGYVPQEDIMIRELTVWESIRYSAFVRLPKDWTDADINEYADAVIKTLGLWEVKHQIIGDENTRGISGGQRKRVNIGLELAAAPLALFADEPTSGLDSTAALSVAQTLKKIASLGVMVISILHQPRYEIFQEFDDLLLIAPGGRTVYQGPRSDVIDYFKNLGFEFESHKNPADVLMDILSGKGTNQTALSVGELVSTWEKRKQDSNGNLEDETVKKSQQLVRTPSGLRGTAEHINSLGTAREGRPLIYQIIAAHNRSIIQQVRRSNSFILEIGVSLLAGLLMGLSVLVADGEMFRGVYISPYTLVSPAPIIWIAPLLGMIVAIAVGLAGAPAGVKTFGEERSVFWREAAAGHNRFAYYIGKTISVFYRFTVTALHFTAIFYFLGKPIISFDRMFLIVFLQFYSVYGLSSVVSTFTRRENASLLAVVICLFAGAFNGFGPTLKNAQDWNLMFIWEVSYAKWASEALVSEEFTPFGNVYNLTSAVRQYGYTLGQFNLDVSMVFVLGTVLRIITFILLISLHRDKQR